MIWRVHTVYVDIDGVPSSNIQGRCDVMLAAEMNKYVGDRTVVSISQSQVMSYYDEHIEGRDYKQKENGILYTIVYKDV